LFGARWKQYANAVDLDSISQVEVLGITVVSGNQWRDEEVAHTLRLLELIGGTDIPVVPGAVFPLVDRRKEGLLWQAMYGKVAFAGAWDDRW
jgi:inosine-uridine nucleoside N-ribohydrolase